MSWIYVFVARYGVGMIYYKQEKFSLAEVHFRRALAINPQSSALICHVGVVSIEWLTKTGILVLNVVQQRLILTLSFVSVM